MPVQELAASLQCSNPIFMQPASGLQLKTGEISHCWAEEARRWRTSSGLEGPGLPATAADNGGLLCAEVPCMELPEIKAHQVGRLTLLHPFVQNLVSAYVQGGGTLPAQPRVASSLGRGAAST